MLTETSIERYSRQIIVPEIGASGQQRLLDASVALVASRPSYSPALLYLAAAGVGRMGVAMPLSEAEYVVLQPSNPDCTIAEFNADLDEAHLKDCLQPYAVVIAAGDDPAIRQRTNRACVALQRTLVLGAASGDHGWLTVCAGHRRDAPCYECIASMLPAAGGENLHLAAMTAALIATLLAAEALKSLLGIGRPLIGRMLRYDAQAGSFSYLTVEKQPNCEVCCRTA